MSIEWLRNPQAESHVTLESRGPKGCPPKVDAPEASPLKVQVPKGCPPKVDASA